MTSTKSSQWGWMLNRAPTPSCCGVATMADCWVVLMVASPAPRVLDKTGRRRVGRCPLPTPVRTGSGWTGLRTLRTLSAQGAPRGFRPHPMRTAGRMSRPPGPRPPPHERSTGLHLYRSANIGAHGVGRRRHLCELETPMASHRAIVPLTLAAGLMLSGVVPATAATDAPDGEQPVTVIELTTDDGDLTGPATGGLEALRAPRQDGPSRSAVAEPDGGVALLTEPLATEEFYVAGVTWDGAEGMPADAVVSLRVMEAGEWQEWAELEVESSADEPSATGGTEPYIAAGAEAVQVQVSGAADRLPAGLRLTLTPDRPSDEEVVLDDAAPAPVAPSADPVAPAPTPQPPFQRSPQPTNAPAATARAQSPAIMAASTAPRPSITSRAGWGADETLMRWRPSYVNLRAAVVHHTAGTNNYTQSQSASIVRGIYHYHAVSRGWGDIGYNYLVDKWGRIYEGRSGTLAAAPGQMPVGAHAAPFNTGTMGVSVMGDYTQVGVPQVAMDAMADVIAWEFARAGLDPTTRSGLISPGTAARPKGQNLARVFAHRDVSATACPGNEIYGRIGSLAAAAKNRITETDPWVPPGDPIDHTARVYLNNDWSPWSSVDFRLGNRSTQVYSGDWDGDGKDTLALRVGSTFYVYNQNVTGAQVWIAAYGRPDDEVLVGDWDGDGRDSFAVRRGKTFYVKNSITPGDADEVFAYGRERDEVLVGDWDRDGRSTFAVRRGDAFHVKNSITGGDADVVITYGRPGDRVLVGDWDGDGRETFAVRRGFTYHVKNTIAGGDADLVLNYGRRSDSVVVGDWDGNGTDTLGVHRP